MPRYDQSTIDNADKRAAWCDEQVKKVKDKKLKKQYREQAAKWRSIKQEMLDANAQGA